MGFDNLQAGALRPWDGTGSYYEEPHLASFLGRVNYAYADRYVLTVNARTDASSNLVQIINGDFSRRFQPHGILPVRSL